MRRPILLAVSVALVVLAFAPVAAAQTYNQGGNNQGMNSGGMGSGEMHGMGMDDNMMASPSSKAMSSASATAPASPTASSSATPSASASASASASGATSSATAAPSHELPDTGGVPLAALLSAGAFVFLAGSGVFTARLMRRH
jgi:hypothetical protein